MNILSDVFNQTLEREGMDITIGSATYKGFFRRNEKGNTTPYSSLYASYQANIEQGQVFTVNGSKYLIIKELTSENTTYRKYDCIKCNATIKWMYGKNDLVVYDCYMKDLADSLKSNSSTIVLSSKIEIWLPLNEDSKRIMLNGRFYCGAFVSANVVTELNYLNGLCYLYAERDTVSTNDDTENGIANRWTYDDKPHTYTVAITESAIEIEQDSTQIITATVLIDGTAMTEQPSINWVVSDGSICSVDGTNTVTGLKVGNTKITGSYKVNDYDISVSDSVDVTIKEKAVVIGNVVVTPVYSGSYYSLLQNKTQVFTCSISGLASPQWSITLNPTSNTASNYTSTIDNSNGTFTVYNKLKSTYYMIYTITETTTGKSATYQMKLGGVI